MHTSLHPQRVKYGYIGSGDNRGKVLNSHLNFRNHMIVENILRCNSWGSIECYIETGGRRIKGITETSKKFKLSNARVKQLFRKAVMYERRRINNLEGDRKRREARCVKAETYEKLGLEMMLNDNKNNKNFNYFSIYHDLGYWFAWF